MGGRNKKDCLSTRWYNYLKLNQTDLTNQIRLVYIGFSHNFKMVNRLPGFHC